MLLPYEVLLSSDAIACFELTWIVNKLIIYSAMISKETVSPWSYKPWWCQPWSILLTGVTLITGSWLLFKTLWITILVSIPLLIWMGYFLLIWPKLVIRSGILESQPEKAQN